MNNNFKKLLEANFVTTGLAMFAMFFGSGNLIFPVAIGQNVGEQTLWALLGLFLTAIIIPFLALTIMLFFDGDYKKFFSQTGNFSGKIIALVILALIGPFGVLPRCIAFSYSTFSIYSDSLSLTSYCFISSVLVFLLSYKKNDIVEIIGNVLTPILIISLIVIIVKGLFAEPIELPKVYGSNLEVLSYGFIEGYKTFDIFAALFFASAIIPAFKKALGNDLSNSKKSVLLFALKSGLVGMGILFLVYAGLSLTAANLRGGLVGVDGDKLLGVISLLLMGKTAGFVANIVVSLACLTTAISLAVVSADFFKKEIFKNLSYQKNLLLVMIISFLFSLMGFSGIMLFVLPILKVLCPAIIVLIFVSILKLKFGFKFVKLFFYVSLLISLGFSFYF